MVARGRRWPWFKLLPLWDGLSLLLAGLVAHLVRFRQEDLLAHWQRLKEHPALVLAGLAACWAVATAAELYHPRPFSRLEQALRVAFAAAFWAVLLAFFTYLVPSWKFGRGLLALTASSWAGLAWATRLGLAHWERKRARPVALVVGPEGERDRLAAALANHPLCPWRLKPVPAQELVKALQEEPAELVLVAGKEELSSELVGLHFSGVPLMVAAEAWALLDGRLPIDQLPPEIFLHQREFGAIHWEMFNRATRVVDVVVALLLLLLALPVMGLVALLVRLVDGSPVLYRQLRLGQFGKPFFILKFRTMKRDAEANGPEFEAVKDPRVTPLGRVLRRFRLDELPQLWNVLRGDMSLVGPRPERPEFVQELAEKIPYYAFRLAVPPGLTGWAQVNMPYARTLEEHKRKLEYDLYFIRERTLSLYLTVLLRTVSAALFGVSR
jgi:exopolysaccharide biosynthesis polyprenyl glycosylphosphotransferase